MKRFGFLLLGLIAACALIPVPFGLAATPIGATTATLGAANAAATVALTNHGTCTALLGSGLTGTEIFEQSTDGTTWTAVTAFPDPGNAASGVQSVANPSAAEYQANVAGYILFRVRVSSYVSGSNTVTINCNTGAMAAFQANTPAPAFTANQSVTIVAPTNAAGNVTTNDSNLLPTPYASPTSGFAPTSAPLTNAQLECMNVGGSLAITAGNVGPVKCNGQGYIGVVPQNAAPATLPTASAAFNTLSQQYIIQAGLGYPRLGAASPGPSGIPALGPCQASGTGCAPIVCTSQAFASGTTVSSTTIAIGSASGKLDYICSVSITAVGTAGYSVGLQYGTKVTNNCDTGAQTLFLMYGATDDHLTLGSGVGQIGFVPSGNQLCTVGSGTTTNWFMQINYTQF